MAAPLSTDLGVKLSKDGSIHVTDEIINTITSSFGAIASIIGVAFLLMKSFEANKILHFVAFIIYGFGLITLFVISALHHGVNGSPRTNHILREIDYWAIFFMIAGTLTPFCLILLNNTFGWTVLIAIWIFAATGIFIKACRPNISRFSTTTLYVGMGWLGIAIFYPIYQKIHWQGISLILLGGLLYTIGAAIYLIEKPNPIPGKFGFHEIWHLFVLSAAATHYSVMLFYLLPFPY